MTLKLKAEIELASRSVITDSYPVSIGEIASIYHDNELDIHPEFQRMFRWDDNQKSRLIESIFLGIPIPPIFVFQSENNVWEVVDGLQRISTIFQFMGLLKDVDGKLLPPLILRATHFLPSAAGIQWKSDDETSLNESLQVLFKRKKLHFNILAPGSDPSTKYDLFDRLNSGGSQLTSQEMRNCLIIMTNKRLFEAIKELSQYHSFTTCLPMSENDIEIQTDKEYVVKFLVARNIDIGLIDTGANMNFLLTDEIERIALTCQEDWDEEKVIFKRVFDLLADSIGENSFKRWNGARFTGPVLYGAYECIVLGLSRNIDYWEAHKADLSDKIKTIYQNAAFTAATARGVRATDRFKRVTALGLELFTNG